MKHLRYIATSTIILSTISPSVFALDMSSGYMNMPTNSLTNNILGTEKSLMNNADEDENVSNLDDFEVKSFEIKNGNFSIGNVTDIVIDGNLYVYGNFDVSNSSTFTVNGKLKVTGNLILGNGDIENNGRIYVGGKKKLSNGSIVGPGAKVTSDFAKYDPILRADLDKEEELSVQNMIITMKKKIEVLKQEIKTATEKKERLEPIKDKIRKEKELFFNDLKPFIQTEDMGKFEKIIKEDTSATETFLVTFKRTGEPSEKLRGQISAIVAKMPAEKREAKLIMLVAKLDTMLSGTKLSEKKKLLLSQVKEALEDELDGLAGDSTLDELIGNDTPPTKTPTETPTETPTVNTGSSAPDTMKQTQ